MNYGWFRLSILGAMGLTACATRGGFDELGDDTSSNGSSSESPGDGDGDGEPEPSACENPEPILQAGTEIPSGFVRCADGFVHRVEAVACEAPGSVGSCQSPTENFGCMADADCVDGPFGSCNDNYDGYCSCSYGCETDADCPESTVCACAGVVGSRSQCVPAECSLTDGCVDGLCGLDTWLNVCDEMQGYLACTTEASTCRVDEACGIATCEFMTRDLRCAAELGWSCQTQEHIWCGEYCGEGRPFIVGGEARTARPCRRDDWSTRSRIDDGALAQSTRDALADHWARVGLAEHASVASFARFGLQLLKLGAPPQLLVATHEAMLDEIEHARLAFALASRFAGRMLGPDGLPVERALRERDDARAIVRSLIEEACVGETLAAIEAHHAAALTTDDQVARTLERIASDELRHAQLGWSALRWMLGRADASLRFFALECLERAMLAAGCERGNDGFERAGFGVPSASSRAQVRDAAIREVLRPCAATLL